MLSKSIVCRRDFMSEKAIESFTALFLSNRKLHLAKSKHMWTGKVCLVSDADFRTREWSPCLAKVPSRGLSGPKSTLLRTWPLHSGKHPPLTSPQKFCCQSLCTAWLAYREHSKTDGNSETYFHRTQLSAEWPLCGNSLRFGNLRGMWRQFDVLCTWAKKLPGGWLLPLNTIMLNIFQDWSDEIFAQPLEGRCCFCLLLTGNGTEG